MQRVRWILVAFAFLAGTIASELFSDAIAKSTQIRFLSDALRHEVPVNLITLAIFLAGVLAASISYFSDRLRRSEAEILRLSSEVDIASSKLHDLNLVKYIDRTTRIPNETKFEEELADVGKAASSGQPFQLAMIDLQNFGTLNDTIGYSAADEIIRAIAQDMFKTMRRNEGMFKTTPNEASDKYFTERLYRKHSGGDEFLIIVEGPEFEALGLLNRFAGNAERYSEIARTHGSDWRFGFHAGICPIERNDTAALARKRVEDCLLVAKRSDHGRSMYWYSELKADDTEDDRWQRLPPFAQNIYRKATSLTFDDAN
ncbi:Diguanylate cyclase DosC [Sulfitobacter sp. THAF37]|uniref:GGDEF domain-containing protein n=1 Tax=Sulfitobacter sp. THAF37 TaxID=2587855 RepID=UPI001268E161|nr:diguanylate cyclase [Sulfitobacter sp. THAF37]QFT57441.1 Diguanylate cyclase DosC [Sulfitobacter sp. THAF37]